MSVCCVEIRSVKEGARMEYGLLVKRTTKDRLELRGLVISTSGGIYAYHVCYELSIVKNNLYVFPVLWL